MDKTLLILIGGDPANSPRPAEAVRIAAGVGAWQKVRVSVYLQGPAVRCLTEYPDELTGGNLLEEYLPSIPQHGGEILIEPSASGSRSGLRNDLPWSELSANQLRQLLEKTSYSMNFDARLEPLLSLPPVADNHHKLVDQIFSADLVHLW